MGNHARLYPPVWGRGTDGAEEDLLPAHQPLLRHCLVLGSGAPVIGIRIDGNASPRGKKPCDFNVLGSHQPDEVFQDDVDAVFMESAMVAEAEEVELKALALHHEAVGYVVYDDFREVGLPGLGAERGEFGTCEGDHVVVVGVLVDESLEHLGRVVRGVFCALVSQQRAAFEFFCVSAHSCR